MNDLVETALPEKVRLAFEGRSWLSGSELAAALGINDKTFRRHIANGEIGYISIGVGQKRETRRFFLQHAADFLRMRTNGFRPAPAIIVEVSSPTPKHEPSLPANQRRAIRGQKVYFIKAGDTVKIGIAKNPHDRLRTLQVARPERLELLAVIAGGEKREAALHRRFSKHSIGGEWFRLEGELKTWIEAGCQP